VEPEGVDVVTRLPFWPIFRRQGYRPTLATDRDRAGFDTSSLTGSVWIMIDATSLISSQDPTTLPSTTLHSSAVCGYSRWFTRYGCTHWRQHRHGKMRYYVQKRYSKVLICCTIFCSICESCQRFVLVILSNITKRMLFSGNVLKNMKYV